MKQLKHYNHSPGGKRPYLLDRWVSGLHKCLGTIISIFTTGLRSGQARLLYCTMKNDPRHSAVFKPA
jgi:hypothetical protein